ncbi:MAG TPA: hypothetical protein PKW55_05385 [Spirochaetota bacterium]|nr:hypothetical protein [Spirochaetota bacterium]HOM37615.1 hypothetical protein [Spirochaetota bacterium]HPQ49414.1 hypothetical protein [Spirochaetota bacterium]
MKKLLYVCFFVVFFFISSVYSIDEKKGLIYTKFKMYPANGVDPYTLVYPLEITGPGKIRVYLQVQKGNGKLSFSLVDVRAFDKKDNTKWWQDWLNKANKYHIINFVDGDYVRSIVDYGRRQINNIIGKKEKPPVWFHGHDNASMNNNGKIEYVVDDLEIKTTEGKYVVTINNYSNSNLEGVILIDFPGDIFDVERDLWESIPNKADLIVKDVSLNRSNQIVVRLSKDKGWMPDALWKLTGDKAVMLKITVSNKVFDIPLSVFDPEKKLKYGEVVYILKDFNLTSESDVSVYIDSTDQVAEINKANNKVTVKLNPENKGSSERQKRG